MPSVSQRHRLGDTQQSDMTIIRNYPAGLGNREVKGWRKRYRQRSQCTRDERIKIIDANGHTDRYIGLLSRNGIIGHRLREMLLTLQEESHRICHGI